MSHRFLRRRLTFSSRLDRCDDGFTIVELMVSVFIATLVFASLAAMLAAGLKTLGVAKTRTRANEIATQAIEDLQRLSYDSLGECDPPSDPAPAGLTDTVYLANCTNYTANLAEPCTPLPGTIPQASYTCTQLSIKYSVARYIAWADEFRTIKRIGVFVSWRDQVGNHLVSQQSSLRAPDQGSIVGLTPPSFTSLATANPLVRVNGSDPATQAVTLVSGTIQAPIQFSADIDGLPDSVYVTIYGLSDGVWVPQILPLASFDGVTWSATLPANSPQFSFVQGTQYVNFTAIRSGDSKTASQPSINILRFRDCQLATSGASCPTVTPPAAPTFATASASPATVSISATGALCTSASLTIAATTTNLATTDTMVIDFQSLTGPRNQIVSSTGANTWSVTMTPANGYRFAPGSLYFYLTASELYNPPSSYGQTTVKEVGPVQFTSPSGTC